MKSTVDTPMVQTPVTIKDGGGRFHIVSHDSWWVADCGAGPYGQRYSYDIAMALNHPFKWIGVCLLRRIFPKKFH